MLLLLLRALSKQSLSFGGDDVVAQGGLSAGDAFGELEHEVAFLDALRDFDQVFNKSHKNRREDFVVKLLAICCDNGVYRYDNFGYRLARGIA